MDNFWIIAPLLVPIILFLAYLAWSQRRAPAGNALVRDKLVDTMQDAVIVLDYQNRLADLNPAAQHLTGHKLNQALGQPASEILAHWPILQQRFQIITKDPTELRIISDLHGRWYHSQINPLRDRKGQSTGTLIVLRDITDQKKAEEEAARLATVIEQAQETVVITGLDGTIQYVNPHFEQITGYSAAEVIGKNPNILKSGKQGADFYAQLWQKITQGQIWSGRFINQRKDGSLYHEAATIFPIRGSDRQITQFVAVKRDISAQVAAEAALQDYSYHLACLHEMGIELALCDTLDEICQLAVSRFQQNLRFDRIGLWLIDPHNPQYLVGTYGIDERGQLRDERHHRLKLAEDNIPEVLLTKQERIFLRPNAPLRNDTQTVIGQGDQAVIGLWNGNELIGYFSVDNLLTQQSISEMQREILVIFGQIIENQINRQRIEDRLRLTARQSQLLNEITQAVIEQDDFQKTLQTLADRMGELHQADGCYITLWDELEQRTLGGAAYGPMRERYAQASQPWPGEPTLTEQALKSGQPVIVEDSLNTPYLSRRLAEQFPARSILALPLIANQQKLGGALIAFNDPHVFSADEIGVGLQAARQLALAILKTRLLEAAQQRAKEAETLRQAGIAIAVNLELDKAIQSILEELNRVVPYDSASVQLLRGEELEIVGERGLQTESVLGMRFPVKAGTPNAQVFEQKKPVILEDAPLAFAEFRQPPHAHIRGWMGVPLIIQDQPIGMLALDSNQPGNFNPDHSRLATAFAAQVAIALENARLFEETQRLAITDSLTGLFNRRHFMELARQEFKRSLRYTNPLSVIMLDIDNFKAINDTYGHLVGDQILQQVAACCKHTLRATDMIGRFGGEEFVVILPETAIQFTAGALNLSNRENAGPLPGQVVAERLRAAVAEQVWVPSSDPTATTISIGIAELSSGISNVETLIDQADQALLRAKAEGKNRVVIWQPKE